MDFFPFKQQIHINDVRHLVFILLFKIIANICERVLDIFVINTTVYQKRKC